VIRASDLAGKLVRRENGEVLGHVFEIRVRDSRVVALICGSRGFFQRMKDAVSGHRVEWGQVRKLTAREIIIADAPAKAVRRRGRGRRTPRPG
jgi:sporulation protein YlmC with PRC-barrel domain